MRVVIADDSGYVGRKLAVALAQRGAEVTCIVPRLHESAASDPHLRFVPWHALTACSVPPSSQAYYIELGTGPPGGDESVRQFAARIRNAGIKQLVHLAPWTTKAKSSPRSWLAPVNATISEIRTSAVLGEGSAAFEMIRNLVEWLPVIPCASWMMAPLQPVAITDLVQCLIDAAKRPVPLRQFAGASVETYSTMMAAYARARRLPRLMLPVRMPQRWSLALVAAVSSLLPAELQLVASAAGTAAAAPSELTETGPTRCDEAIRRALERHELPRIGVRLVPEGQRTRHITVRRQGFIMGQWQTLIAAPPGVTFAVIEAMGGDRGWLFADELWRLRGWLDRMVGGPGLARGRRDGLRLESGDVVDFWRVEEIHRGKLLRLRAEMKVPGEAWLQFECVESDAATLLQQTILFEPHGVSGQMYWAAMYPFHSLLFEGMHQAIASEARRQWQAKHELARPLPDSFRV